MSLVWEARSGGSNMVEFIDAQGASASNGGFADYSGNFFSFPIDGAYSSYYVTRYASAVQAVATLSGNSIFLFGSAGSDQVFINAQVSADNENSSASSSGNLWYADLGEGDDASVIHTLASSVGLGASASVSYDVSTLYGGAGADILQVTHYVGALAGALTSVAGTSRFISGGEGYDFINAEVTIESGHPNFAGGNASYAGNFAAVDAGADGGQVLAVTFINSWQGGSVSYSGNSLSFAGGSVLNANSSIQAGMDGLAGGSVSYTSNVLNAVTADGGGQAFAQNTIFAANGGFVDFSGNSTVLSGLTGADLLGLGVGFSGGSVDLGVSGGSAVVANNVFSANGNGGDDTLDFYLNGSAENGGSAIFVGNHFSGDGGEGDDTLNLNWWTSVNGGTFLIDGNSADLAGGAGADTLNAYLGEGTLNSFVNLAGGDGDDFIQSIDFGINNQRLISGGAGNDTIIDDAGFSTVIFEGSRAEYVLSGLNGGGVLVEDVRAGSTDGIDQLFGVDQIRFADGDVLVADLYLPIYGTEGADSLRAGENGATIFGLGGNDQIIGGDGDDYLDGGAGNDVLTALGGNDTLIGGTGNDQLIGNRGSDQLSGGAGADRFVFGALFQSTPDAPDLITDFSGRTVLSTNGQGHTIRTPGEGDRIDLSLIDANTSLSGDQAFTLVQHGFSGHAGEAYGRFDAANGLTSLYLDVDGDGIADMTIQLLGRVNLTGADFIL
jgi:hypothetical protein